MATSQTHDTLHDLRCSALVSLTRLDWIDDEFSPLLESASVASLHLSLNMCPKDELRELPTHEVKNTPHLVQAILDECTGQRKAGGTLYLLQCQAQLCLRALQAMGFIDNHNP